MNTELVSKYIKARHPGAKFFNAADSYVIPGTGVGITRQQAEAEAEAEIEMWRDGLAKRPEWL